MSSSWTQGNNSSNYNKGTSYGSSSTGGNHSSDHDNNNGHSHSHSHNNNGNPQSSSSSQQSGSLYGYTRGGIGSGNNGYNRYSDEKSFQRVCHYKPTQADLDQIKDTISNVNMQHNEMKSKGDSGKGTDYATAYHEVYCGKLNLDDICTKVERYRMFFDRNTWNNTAICNNNCNNNNHSNSSDGNYANNDDSDEKSNSNANTDQEGQLLQQSRSQQQKPQGQSGIDPSAVNIQVVK